MAQKIIERVHEGKTTYRRGQGSSISWESELDQATPVAEITASAWIGTTGKITAGTFRLVDPPHTVVDQASV